MPTCCRSAPATCRTTACWRRSATRASRCCLKRGPGATMDELLLAAEYILNAGNPNVMLCERGIRTFETHTRFTLALGLGALPARPDAPAGGGRSQPRHGPHGAGAADGRRRVAAGADGLIIEVHPDPENALSDGYQSLNFKQFEEMMALCRKVAAAIDRVM